MKSIFRIYRLWTSMSGSLALALGATRTCPASAGDIHRRRTRHFKLCVILLLLLKCVPAPAADGIHNQQLPALSSIRKVYIEKMPNDLDQYLRAEIAKQFKGSLTVVLDKKYADAVLTGIDEERTGTGAQITGRYLSLHDNATGTISLLDKAQKNVLWTDEAGDRSLLFGMMKRGGQRKVAERLVAKMKKAMDRSR